MEGKRIEGVFNDYSTTKRWVWKDRGEFVIVILCSASASGVIVLLRKSNNNRVTLLDSIDLIFLIQPENDLINGRHLLGMAE